MSDRKMDVDALMAEVLALVHNYDLHPGLFVLTLVIPRKEFEVLKSQYPSRQSALIRIAKGNEWSISFFPILEPGDYPTGKDLKPDSFRGTHDRLQRNLKPSSKKSKAKRR